MTTNRPRISVLMAVLNGVDVVSDAIESIIGQTFQDFEFIIVNDGSTDSTSQILKRYQSQDNRIIVIDNGENLGLPASLNKGLDIARGDYIARQDADDISHLHRLECQIRIADKLSADLVTSDARYFVADFDGFFEDVPESPKVKAVYWKDLSLHNTLIHGTYLIRKSCILDIGKYNVHFLYAQDYDLVRRMSLNGISIFTIEFALYAYKLQLRNRNIFKRYLFGKEIRGETIPTYLDYKVVYGFQNWAYRNSHYFRKVYLVEGNPLLRHFYRCLGYLLYPPLICDHLKR